MNYEGAVKSIRKNLKSYLEKGKLESVVMGISGGVDSTLCALLAKPVCDELNIPLIGRSLPAKSNSSGENNRASEIGGLFCTEFQETSIQSGFTKVYDLVDNNYDVYPGNDETKENILAGNIKARIRMILLYDLAGAFNGLVLSTDNYTELLLGFWTLHGDVGDYGMIQELWKTEVYEMAEWIANNELETEFEKEAVMEVINADATDGLGISKTDLDQILPGWEGSSRNGYEKVDFILKDYLAILEKIRKEHVDFSVEKEIAEKNPVIQRHIRTHFKRENPYNIPRYMIDPGSKYNN